MTFIITIISLVIERFFHWSHLRHWRWFHRYQSWLNTRISNWPSYLLLAICVLPLMIVVGVINCVLAGWLYGILQLIFGVIVLLYCMGPNNLWVQTFACISELHQEDPKIAVDRAQSAFSLPIPESSQAFHQALTGAIFVEANKRIFAAVFWFVVFGPLGAVLYRSIALCAEQSELGLTQAATQVQRLLDWIPVRILTFLFALGGHFTRVFALWRSEIKTGVNGNDKILTDCGIAALDMRDSNRLPEDGSAEKAALDLLDRVFVMGLVVLAIIVLAAK